MVPRRQRVAFYTAHPNLPGAQQYMHQQQFSFYRPGYGDSRAHAGAYQMGPYGPPPPAYGHEDYVPAYMPPQGPNKINPDQNYQPPMGAPPGESSSHPQQQYAGGDLSSR